MTAKVYTPEVLEKIRQMVGTHSAEEIAKKIGVTMSSLQSFCHYSGISLRRGGIQTRFNIRIRRSLVESFDKAASERGMETNDLIKLLLETIAKDNMFDAILADAIFEMKTLRPEDIGKSKGCQI
jgi:antitoxin component of RelBE/YafQ-DinJ toxin-antitoxin module